MMRVFSAALLALLVLPAAAGAQSLFSTRGLGVPVEPVDARARALGGIGVGMLGWTGSMVNPAEAAGVYRRGIAAAIQPSRRSVEFDGETDILGGTRFPLIRAVLPFGERVGLAAGYGGFLDQSWAVASETTVPIGGQQLRAVDLIESNGGVAQARLDIAYLVTPSLGVGVGAGMYTGRLERIVSRSFPDTALIEGFRTVAAWNYSAPSLSVGAWWEPLPIARVGAAVTWAGELRGEPEEGTTQGVRVDLPLQFAAGASGQLAPGLMAVAGARWAGWSSAANGFDDPAIAADPWEVGGGLEWGGGRALGRPMPLRLGARYARLPFRVEGATPTAWALALGVGSLLARDEFGPRAVVDAAIERGRRGGDSGASGLTENFWRFTISMSLFGQ